MWLNLETKLYMFSISRTNLLHPEFFRDKIVVIKLLERVAYEFQLNFSDSSEGNCDGRIEMATRDMTN